MSTWYRVLYFLHIATILVAFAPVLVAVLPHGAPGARAPLERVGPPGYAPALILTGLLRVLLIIEPQGDDLDEPWISPPLPLW